MKKNIEYMVDIPYNNNEQLFDVVYFKNHNGRYAVKEFINSIVDKKMYVRIYRSIELLNNWGNMVSYPYSKYLRDGIYELRIISGNNHVRILYFFDNNRTIVLTNAFYKKNK